MQRCPHCHHALEDGLLPICWHCGRETQVEPTEPAAAVPAPAKVAPPPLVAKAPEPPVAFGFDQLDEELHFEPGFIEAAIGAPAAPPPMTHAAAATPPPVAATAAAPASKLRVPAMKLPAVKLPEMKLPDLKRYRIPLLAVAGLGAVALTLSVMGRPNAATEMTSNPAPAPAPAPSTPAPSAPAPAPAPAPAASAAAPAPPAPAPSVPAPAPEPAPPAAAAVSAPPPAPPAPAPAAVASTPGASDVRIEEAPGWIMPRRAGYASDGSRLLTLQVAALRELQVSRQ